MKKLPYLILGTLMVLFGGLGYDQRTSTLAWSMGLVMLFLIVSFAFRKPRTIRLVDMWLLGFVYFFGGESLIAGDLLAREFDVELVYRVEAFLVAAFGFTMIGYGVAVRYRDHTRPMLTRPAPVYFVKPEPSLPMQFAWLVLFSLVMIYIFFVLTPQQLLSVARHQRTGGDLNLGYFTLVLSSGLIALPIINAYLYKCYRTTIVIRGILLVTGLMCMGTAYLIGTRFIIGFIVTGTVFILFQGFQNITKKQIVILLLSVMVLAGLQGGMKLTRGIGFQNVSFEGVADYKAAFLLSAEGLMRINALILEKEPYLDPESPFENLFIFIYWIPRSVWPGKPTLGGDWFHKKYLGTAGLSENHSFSGGFAMPALLDFGPLLGALFSMVYGLMLAGFERLVERYRVQCQSTIIIPALLYFGAFFMMRSLFTSIIVIMNVAVSVVLPLRLCERFATRKRCRHF